PVKNLPPEVAPVGHKDQEQSIPLSLLQQPPADAYRLDTGDVLGVWVDGVLGDRRLPIPVHMPLLAPTRLQQVLPPSAGYPFRIGEDGTLRLPLIEPVPVRGLTLTEAD